MLPELTPASSGLFLLFSFLESAVCPLESARVRLQ